VTAFSALYQTFTQAPISSIRHGEWMTHQGVIEKSVRSHTICSSWIAKL
jgi:hypothetical protein